MMGQKPLTAGDIMVDPVDDNCYILLEFFTTPVSIYNYWSLFDTKNKWIIYIEEAAIMQTLMRKS